MKTKLLHSLSKHCIPFAMLFATFSFTAAQDAIYEVDSLFPREAIVRHWHTGNYLVYSHDGTDAHFTLINIPSATAYDISMTINASINDLEIHNKHAYFCGSAAGQPVLGCFEIDPIRLGGTALDVFFLGTPNPSNQVPNTFETIRDLHKLEVQRCPDGLHIYMIGTAHFSFNNTINRCVVDFSYDESSGIYNCVFSQETAGFFQYDDIAVTDSEVIAVGHKVGNGGNLYATNFIKPASAAPGNDIYSTTASPIIYYANAIGCTKVRGMDSTYLIENLHDDYYAVVGYVGDTIAGYYSCLSIFRHTTLVEQILVPMGTFMAHLWQIKDLRYHAGEHRLYMLQKMAVTGQHPIESVIMAFELDPTGAILNAEYSYEPHVEYFSIDEGSPKNLLLAVGQAPTLRLWHTVASPTNCIPPNPLPYTKTYLPNSDFLLDLYPTGFLPLPNTMYIPSRQYSLTINCR